MHTGDKCAKKKTNTDIARLVMTIHVHCFHHNHHLRKKKERKHTCIHCYELSPNNMKNSNDRIVSVKSRFFFLRSTTKKKR